LYSLADEFEMRFHTAAIGRIKLPDVENAGALHYEAFEKRENARKNARSGGRR
jgi:hypothetical protein